MLLVVLTSLMIYIFRFSENIADDPGHVDIFPVSRIPRHLHHLLTPVYRFSSGGLRGSKRAAHASKQKGFRIPTDQRTLSSILQWTLDEEVSTTLTLTNNTSG